jgi:epoxyqueuosine reductase
MSIQLRTQQIKDLAYNAGFSFCGVSKAGFLADEAPKLEQWLSESKHGLMAYMANHFDKRLDPRLLVEGAKTVITFLYNYYPKTFQPADAPYKVSCYAYGDDYHTIVKDKLYEVLSGIKSLVSPDIAARVFVDSAPVLEKAWARKAGAGWVGKHTNLIVKGKGSYFFIGEIILDVDLVPDGPIADFCGTCTRCIDACPTDALAIPYQIDASKCISYLTIELKEAIPSEFKNKMAGWAYGCDICQEVCPWNRFAEPSKDLRFAETSVVQTMQASDWEAITKETFKTYFGKSPIARTKFEGLQRNLLFLNPVLASTQHVAKSSSEDSSEASVER